MDEILDKLIALAQELHDKSCICACKECPMNIEIRPYGCSTTSLCNILMKIYTQNKYEGGIKRAL